MSTAVFWRLPCSKESPNFRGFCMSASTDVSRSCCQNCCQARRERWAYEVAALRPIPSCAVPLCRLFPRFHWPTVSYGPVSFHCIAAIVAAAAASGSANESRSTAFQPALGPVRHMISLLSPWDFPTLTGRLEAAHGSALVSAGPSIVS